jgi:hypothetical protein
VDLSDASFEEFLAFVFDHSVVPEGDAGKQWYFRHELHVRVDPRRQVQYLTRLFKEAAVLRLRFTPEQIEQGFWFMFVQGEPWFMDPFWDPNVPWPERHAAILAIPKLYSDLFEQQSSGTAPWMLWDLLAHGLNAYPGKPPERVAESEKVREAMSQALRHQLRSSNADTQRAALHGFLDIEHPDGAAIIRSWLDSTADLTESSRHFAEEVIAGRAL